jgi:hypothetical protein
MGLHLLVQDKLICFLSGVIYFLDGNELLHYLKFKVCKSMPQQTIQINHQLDAKISPVYCLDVYLQLNIFRASSRLSSRAEELQ